MERLVDTLGFSEQQYIAVCHNDTDHEHIHVAINKIHPETFRIHSPAWDHQRFFTGVRALERELGLTPLPSRARERERVPQRAADCEAHHGVHSFARWAREKLRPATMNVPDAGAQGGSGGNGAAQSEFYNFDRPIRGWLLTDVDQVGPGKAIIRYNFPDPWIETGKLVDTQQFAWWSIEWKILVQCSPDRPFSLEIIP